MLFQGYLPQAFDKSISIYKAAASPYPGGGTYRPLSSGPDEHWLFNELVTPPLHPFSTWLWTDFGKFRNMIICEQFRLGYFSLYFLYDLICYKLVNKLIHYFLPYRFKYLPNRKLKFELICRVLHNICSQGIRKTFSNIQRLILH